jgi:hypothetical protein
MFRHERPQRGRYRQFHQIGVEALGFAGPDVDAEVIVMCQRLWDDLGLRDIRLELNTIGDPAERRGHRAELIAWLEGRAALLDDDARRRLHTNPLRILDTKNPALQAALEQAPRLADHLGDAYPELRERRGFIAEVVRGEEERFSETREKGLALHARLTQLGFDGLQGRLFAKPGEFERGAPERVLVKDSMRERIDVAKARLAEWGDVVDAPHQRPVWDEALDEVRSNLDRRGFSTADEARLYGIEIAIAKWEE